MRGVENVFDKDDQESITLRFIFKENSFFNEKVLVRKAKVVNGQFMCIEGDPISWKDGQCLTHSIKKVSNKKTGEKSTKIEKKLKSFFDIFLNWDQKNMEELVRVSGLMEEIANFVTMDSIDYFLGVINADEISVDDE